MIPTTDRFSLRVVVVGLVVAGLGALAFIGALSLRGQAIPVPLVALASTTLAALVPSPLSKPTPPALPLPQEPPA